MKIFINPDKFITDDSRECEQGCYFLASGAGAAYASAASAAGAECVDTARAMEILGVREIKIIGITGTNGKTTTAAALAHILNELGHKTALAGTRGVFIQGAQIAEKNLTTEPLLRTLLNLKTALDAGCEYYVMEVSSHAIAQGRVEGLSFALKVFTNLSQDHLDYHGDMANYAAVKSSFFADEAPKLINRDDEFIKFNPKNAATYSIKTGASYYPLAFGLAGGVDAVIKTPKAQIIIDSLLQGEFNLYNLLAAAASADMLLAPNQEALEAAITSFNGVAGRMQVVSQSPLVIVDFAHTPDGIEKALNALRHLRLVSVFGAGGDRDRSKRPLMAKAAQRHSQICVITSDNPRSENPNSIIDEIASGMSEEKEYYKVSDRREAIRLGLELTQRLGDGAALVLLGKGDEEYQEIAGVKHKFSDTSVASELIREMYENRNDVR
ncbi:UDP-N-acetylmuramoyl-L-alanyl-D-glutamate--2,6-diaminopimelate ligase [Campylobacter sp. 19-13652]|uniref:UDP-N-acetylmuramoyl-L-alanyl-D-glutamate--2, 6-diaminopimelate ligase n=1 Tax=Campylobacter sp. 19-13652 TaxID=2840180 RepID=UPI001C7418B5|nr:UDP-N-acetylmuramoyl-L-alanyl-D-glutamate--2,6-diaminopimelate ligase [Campylobacter sp. 19-13652]BCX78719.1 UDP-N-acetylmuramoyl-L-alanyl-D-glutamate--2,6-diaminopimelate ligase [Campylobacter sp. 19-13652]